MNKGLEVTRGKTKALYEKPGQSDVLIVSALDNITAGDGAWRDEIPGKGRIAAKTTARVFRLLNLCGLPTHYLSGGEDDDDNEMLVRRCSMLPLEVVVRGAAAGSLVRRKPGIARGAILVPRLVEFFVKDDANHDPLIEPEDIVHRGLATAQEIGAMSEIARITFEILAHAWRRRETLLVDLKLEFGRLQSGEGRGNLVIADVIDNDSWRIWPQGREDLMLDKQAYRNLDAVTAADLERVRDNYELVAEMVGGFPMLRPGMVALVADGPGSLSIIEDAARAMQTFGLQALRRVVSTHLVPGYVLQAVQQLDATFSRIVYVASGPQLAAMLAAATPTPVFDATEYDAEELGLVVAKTLAVDDTVMFGRVLLVQANARSAVLHADAQLNAPPQQAQLVKTAVHLATLPVLDGADDGELGATLRAHGLALKTDEARRIAATLGRDPSLVEAHAFDAQWSEHCSYKSSRHYLRRLPSEGPSVMQGPQEDAGIVHLGEFEGKRYGIVIAHESHNHPSQVVPFEGAATGIGGIVRDVLCMGARVIALADPLRFGPLDDAHCRYVAQGVVDGIAAYGNAIGVPTIAGDVYVHEGYRDNCLVNVVALGLIEQSAIIHSCAPPDSAGWDIVLVGKATDRSGFGGAAFSSLVLDGADAEQNKGAVQVPDPFLKNVLMRASYRAFDLIAERGMTVGFKDLGAGGIMGCTAEITSSGGFGAVIDLDRCPTSQDDLPAAVIAVGETQERLTWVVPPEFTPALLAIYNEDYSLPEIARGAQAAVIGTVTAERTYVLRHHGETVMDVPIDFLTGDIRYERVVEAPRTGAAPRRTRGADEPTTDEAVFAMLLRVLAHRDVCSRAPIFERFDSVVRGTTSVPCGYADAGVIVPVPGSPLGCALAVDGNPRYGALDPGGAAEHAVVEAIRNVVAVGATPAGLTDCLNYGNPEDPKQLGELVAGVDGLAVAARELGVAFVSGNVSLYNQSAAGRAIPASPIVACVGTLADVSLGATASLKGVGSVLYRLGRSPQDLGGSVYAELAAIASEPLPAIDYDATRREIAALLAAHAQGLVLAAHDVSDGGLLVALAEMAFAADLAIGIALDVACEERTAFAESGSFIVETKAAAAFEALCAQHGATVARIGETIADPVLRCVHGFETGLRALHEAWSEPLRDFYADAVASEAHA